eukprot:SAG31_NODE_3377_length_4345_cov_2.113048_3_plen_599_part_01
MRAFTIAVLCSLVLCRMVYAGRVLAPSSWESIRFGGTATKLAAFLGLCITVITLSGSFMQPHFSKWFGLVTLDSQAIALPLSAKSRLIHTEHGTLASDEIMQQTQNRWKVQQDVAFVAQPGGLLTEAAKYGANFANMLKAETPTECADIASDLAMSMWVHFPNQSCAVATRLPAGSKRFIGAVSGKTRWTPNFSPEGMISYTDVTGFIGETSLLRFKGVMYTMESCGSTDVGTHFRIRKLSTGQIISNVTQSGGHSFFSAQVDNVHGKVWVFGIAHNRHGHAGDPKFPNNKVNRCDRTPYTGCYIGAWSSTDMVHWTKTVQAVHLPEGSTIGNNAVAMVTSDKYDHTLPKHQAIMAVEMADCAGPYPQCMQTEEKYCFAVNTGTDGDLSKNWKILGAAYCSQIHSCPSINYDKETGYYYQTGGGSTIVGPDRSRDLMHWERSPMHPVSRPSVELDTPIDNKIAPYYTGLWSGAKQDVVDEAKLNLQYEQTWNWGHSDAELCCSDGLTPSHIVYINSAQGHPNRNTLVGTPGPQEWKQVDFNYVGLGTYNGTLNEWLRSYFPDPGATYCGDTVNLCGEHPERRHYVNLGPGEGVSVLSRL